MDRLHRSSLHARQAQSNYLAHLRDLRPNVALLTGKVAEAPFLMYVSDHKEMPDSIQCPGALLSDYD